MLISSRLPIGVATMYRPGFILNLLILFIFINSCAPVNYTLFKKEDELNKTTEISNSLKLKKNNDEKAIEKNNNLISKNKNLENIKNTNLSKDISIILPKINNNKITDQFINVIELAVYKKKLKNLNFKIELYKDSETLEKIIESNLISGKIFIGPLNFNENVSLDKYCEKGVIFFSFSSKRNLAKDCIFLFNFFPKNEIETLFNNFPNNSKIALLYPENNYGYNINRLVDEIAEKSNSIIVNRSSYNEDLTNAREAIKELGKYELRKYELERQKKLLLKKDDSKSKKRLKKLQKFNTVSDLDFTHILLPDYGIRLLQVAPLLPYYDIDPNLVQFVGTGVWDDPVFFSEPSLQNAIFPGIEISKREDLISEYNEIYGNKLMRTSTLAYDLIGLLAYVYENNMGLNDIHKLLNNKKTRFDGVDGGFYFKDNIIERELNILQIVDNKASKIN